jgi:uncharacterized protein (DUF433 family)
MIMTGARAYRKTGQTTVTLSEAAWLTDLSTKTINAAIDRGELAVTRSRRIGTARRRARNLSPVDLLYLAIRKKLASVLSADARCELYEELVKLDLDETGAASRTVPPQPGLKVTLADGMITVDLKKTVRRLRQRWLALRNAEQLVVSDAGVRGGEPVIRNTRVPVYLLADLINQGAGLDEILEDYPSLNASKVRAALAYVETHPKRGRPKKAPWKNVR